MAGSYYSEDGYFYPTLEEMRRADRKWKQQERQNKLLEEQNKLKEKELELQREQNRVLEEQRREQERINSNYETQRYLDAMYQKRLDEIDRRQKEYDDLSEEFKDNEDLCLLNKTKLQNKYILKDLKESISTCKDMLWIEKNSESDKMRSKLDNLKEEIKDIKIDDEPIPGWGFFMINLIGAIFIYPILLLNCLTRVYSDTNKMILIIHSLYLLVHFIITRFQLAKRNKINEKKIKNRRNQLQKEINKQNEKIKKYEEESVKSINMKLEIINERFNELKTGIKELENFIDRISSEDELSADEVSRVRKLLEIIPKMKENIEQLCEGSD